MQSYEEARDKIFAEVTADDPAVRTEYLKRFEPEAREFSAVMATAILSWGSLDSDAEGNERRTQVSALVFTAVTLHIGSLKLLLSGNTVAAGNLFRQVVETIALALLCSGKDLGILDRFVQDRYSTNDAIRDVLRNGERLGLKEEGVKALQRGQEFYHMYSHPTKITIGAGESFAGEGLYVGASFDPGKAEFYVKEVAGRLSLGKVFPSFVEAVKTNLGKW